MFKLIEIQNKEMIINVYEILYLSFSDAEHGGCLALKNGPLFKINYKTYTALKEMLTVSIDEIVSSEFYEPNDDTV